MRLLWVKIGGLWPPNSGGRLRSYHMVTELAKTHEVTVLTTHAPGEDPLEARRHLNGCREVVSFEHAAPKWTDVGFALALTRSWVTGEPVDIVRHTVPALRQATAERLRGGGFDLCIADFLFAVPNIPDGGPVPVVLFAHNVEHMIWKRLASCSGSPLRRCVLELEWRKSRRYESRALRRAAYTIAVSHADAAALGRLAPSAAFGTVATGVDTAEFRPRPELEGDSELVYVGSMDWYPNEDAVRWFIEAILPLVRRAAPGVKLTVVGRNPGSGLRALAAKSGVALTGTVNDVRDHIARAAVCIVPLRVGGGTRLKIFEALAMGKATVATSIGAEGLPLEPGRHLLLADTAPDFAKAVTNLLRDRGRRRRLGLEGRRLVVERYDWSRVAAGFAELCRMTVSGHGMPAGVSSTGKSGSLVVDGLAGNIVRGTADGAAPQGSPAQV